MFWLPTTEPKKYLVAAIFRASTGQPGVDLFRAEGGWRLVKKCIRHSFSPSLLQKKKKKKNIWECSSPQVKYINRLYFCSIFRVNCFILRNHDHTVHFFPTWSKYLLGSIVIYETVTLFVCAFNLLNIYCLSSACLAQLPSPWKILWRIAVTQCKPMLIYWMVTTEWLRSVSWF